MNPKFGVYSIGFGGDGGQFMISTGIDGTIKIWDILQGHLFYTLNGHKNGATTFATFNTDSTMFASGGVDSKVMVWKCNFDYCL